MTSRLCSALVVLLCCSTCASSIEQFPYPSCLYDSGFQHWRAGSVIAKRDDDGALLFKFRDPFEGDHGFIWILPGDPGKRLRPCVESTLMSHEPPTEHR